MVDTGTESPSPANLLDHAVLSMPSSSAQKTTEAGTIPSPTIDSVPPSPTVDGVQVEAALAHFVGLGRVHSSSTPTMTEQTEEDQVCYINALCITRLIYLACSRHAGVYTTEVICYSNW